MLKEIKLSLQSTILILLSKKFIFSPLPKDQLDKAAIYQVFITEDIQCHKKAKDIPLIILAFLVYI